MITIPRDVYDIFVFVGRQRLLSNAKNNQKTRWQEWFSVVQLLWWNVQEFSLPKNCWRFITYTQIIILKHQVRLGKLNGGCQSFGIKLSESFSFACRPPDSISMKHVPSAWFMLNWKVTFIVLWNVQFRREFQTVNRTISNLSNTRTLEQSTLHDHDMLM